MTEKSLPATFSRQGHCTWWNALCRSTNRRARSKSRAFARQLLHDPELWEDLTEPQPRLACSGYWDERSTLDYTSTERWLLRQVGKPWDEVNSALREMLNLNRRPDREILEYIRREVDLECWRGTWRLFAFPLPGELYLDEEGLLREQTREAFERARLRQAV